MKHKYTFYLVIHKLPQLKQKVSVGVAVKNAKKVLLFIKLFDFRHNLVRCHTRSGLNGF